MGQLAESLLRRASASVGEELRGIGDLEAILAAHVAAGAAQYPHLEVDEGAWIHHFVRHLAAGEVAAQLEDLRAADVHLALACLGGSAAAHRTLEACLRGVSAQALAGFKLDDGARSEMLQDVLTRLLVGTAEPAKRKTASPPKTTARLASYAGRGPLEGWLRVTLTREALSRHRAPSTEKHPIFDAVPAAKEDPQLAALQARCAPTLERAISDALAALPAEDRTLLRLYFLDALTIDDLAVLYRAHRATIARRLARMRAAVFERARETAIRALGIGEAEFGSLMGLVMSALDVTIRGALGDAVEGRV